MTQFVETAMRRDRAVTIGALVILSVLAWGWLFSGAGMSMDPTVSLSAFSVIEPPAPGMAMGMPMSEPAAWTVGHFLLILSMWWVMMVAMMLPSAAPTILLYARASAKGMARVRPATGSFLAGYQLAWGGFSLLAALMQLVLERSDLLARMEMASANRMLSAALLILAGAYQLSPLKQVCLKHCRSPAHFLSRYFRPGRFGALRMGAYHGAYCIGCCWMLMALLFVGGVMNLAWIALLTMLVGAEKLLPFGRLVAIGAGVGCMIWGGLLIAA